MNNLLQKSLNFIYEKFKTSTATMLVFTGTLGWGLSSAAQIVGVLCNPKISKEQRHFLIPQEIADAVMNIGMFFLFTQATKKVVSKLASTGKIAPASVRKFLDKNKVYGDKVGKMSLDLDEVIKNEPKFPKESYYAYKNYTTTLATVGASIVASNIVTPIARNAFASKVQKFYNNKSSKPTGNMRI